MTIKTKYVYQGIRVQDEHCPKCYNKGKGNLVHLEHDRNLDWENEIWICANCNTEFSVHIEFVRDWKDIEEVEQ